MPGKPGIFSEELCSERQFHVAQVFAGFDQDQRTFIDHYDRWAFTGHMPGLGFGRYRRLHHGNFGGVRVNPLQA